MIEARGTTINATGARAGLSRGHLDNVLSGRKKGIDAHTLLAIAQALDVTTDWLLTGEGPIDRPMPKPAPVPAARSKRDAIGEAGDALAAAAEGIAPPAPARSRPVAKRR